MSGILGVWNLDGRPMDEDVLEQMSATIRHRGPDGQHQRVTGSIGFVHHHNWVTSEELGETQPLEGRNGLTLIMDGRLDNRDELVDILTVTAAATDAAFVLAAYEAWGERCVEHLIGDFALAIHDPSRRRLLLARDSIGLRPLYYFRNDRLFAFASEIKALIAHPQIPVRPDDEGIADFMLIGSRVVDQQGHTCFADISALVPAHVAIVTQERTVARRYWDFDPGRRICLRSFDEYVEAFRERFARAVQRRLRSARPVAVSLSGGLDSSSIFCQALQLTASGANSGRIAGISYLGTDGTSADERRYLLEIEDQCGVEIERFGIGPLIGVVRNVNEQITAAEAPHLECLWGIARELHQRTVARGARVLLGGHWGDQVLFSPAYLVDLFRCLSWGEIRRHTREYARWFGAAEAGVLKRRFVVEVVRHHLPRRLAPPFKWIRRRVFGVERQKSWFTDRFLDRALRFADCLATLGEGFHSAQARSIYFEARSKYHLHCVEWQNKAAALCGLDVAYPMLDRDLLAFLMAVPGEVQNRNGVPRGLLREAMRGIVPEKIRTRRSKADFTGVVNAGIAQDISTICQTLSSGSLAVQVGYLDAGRLAPALARLSARLTRDECLDSWDLADLFGLETWLQVFLQPQSRRPTAEASRVHHDVGYLPEGAR